jgi:ElaB/YqjD/DUF883 family membrane-anchored ribosome-binding protein
MTQTTQQLELGRQKIVEDLRVLLTDSEEILRLAANVPGEGVGALRERLSTHVDSLQSALGDAQNAAQRRYRVAAVNTELQALVFCSACWQRVRRSTRFSAP